MKPRNFSIDKKNDLFKELNNSEFVINDDKRNEYIENFVKELEQELKGKDSSLHVLPSFLKFQSRIIKSDKFGVLEFGQTNLTKAYFDSTKDRPEVYGVMNFPMPGLFKEISIKEFFKEVIYHARDVIRTNNKIGICMRHAIESNSDGDGKLVRWSRRKVKCKELEGKFIAHEFKKYLKDEFDEEFDVIVLNDSIATLTAGLVQSKNEEFDDYIGIVHSDGYNLSYLEKADLIEKGRKGDVVLNTQAGGFSKIQKGIIDEEVEKLLGDQVTGQFSQKVNAKCIPIILKAILSKLPRRIIDKKILKGLEKIEDLDLEQLMIFLFGGLKSSSEVSSVFRGARLEDAAILGLVINEIIQRSARLISVQLCGVLKYKGIGHNPLQPVGLIVEGDFFEIVRDFGYRLKCEMFSYFGSQDQRFMKFIIMPNATLMGTGIATLENT